MGDWGEGGGGTTSRALGVAKGLCAPSAFKAYFQFF